MHEVDMRELMNFSDELQQRGCTNERRVVQECIARIRRAFWKIDKEKMEQPVYETKNKLARLINRVDGLTCYTAKGVTWFEYRGIGTYSTVRFDTPEEVLKYVINNFNIWRAS